MCRAVHGAVACACVGLCAVSTLAAAWSDWSSLIESAKSNQGWIIDEFWFDLDLDGHLIMMMMMVCSE